MALSQDTDQINHRCLEIYSEVLKESSGTHYLTNRFTVLIQVCLAVYLPDYTIMVHRLVFSGDFIMYNTTKIFLAAVIFFCSYNIIKT